MNILVVGNVIKDVYLNLDSRTEKFETDKSNVSWLDISFDASKHYFFSRTTNYGGAAVSLEVLQKLGLEASVAGSKLNFADNDPTNDVPEIISDYRYILLNDEKVAYFGPSVLGSAEFVAPEKPVDYIYLDRSAEPSVETADKIINYLNSNPDTKLVLYVRDINVPGVRQLLPYAGLIFLENNGGGPVILDAPELNAIDPKKLIFLSEKRISYMGITRNIHARRIDAMTHLSLYSTAAATILGCFLLKKSVEYSLECACLNVENSKLNASLSLEQLDTMTTSTPENDELEMIARTLVLPPKGILAADESGGSIKKKFATLGIPDTYDNRRDYRNLFFTTKNLEKHVNGVILFDETARQHADNGQNFVDFLTARQIIPGIKVDQGLEKFPNSEETYTKGLDGLGARLAEYYNMGLRFAKWRAAFEVRFDETGTPVTPSDYAIKENCEILAKYVDACQKAGIVPIVEPEVVHDGDYSIETCAEVTGRILDQLFASLEEEEVRLEACILKVNMVLAGKKYSRQSTPEEVGAATAEVLKAHVPANLAGVVFLSGGQTPDQATVNLAAVIENGPFPWPVTFSFARALQDPALYAWSGDNANADAAREAFFARLEQNTRLL